MNNIHNVKDCQKFQQLAKDAQSNGDPVLAQNYLQHADHFLRRYKELSDRKILVDKAKPTGDTANENGAAEKELQHSNNKSNLP